MAPSPSPEIAESDAELLLDVAQGVLADALAGREPTPPELGDLPVGVHQRTGAFVTLRVGDELNGCIGSIEGEEPLGQAVARLALSAAFADPRLPALRPDDYARLSIEISVLSPLRPIAARSWIHLAQQLQPGIDGLLIRRGTRHGVFLPAVWEQLPEPADFLDKLYRKAGLMPRSWSAGNEASRFTTQSHRRAASRRSVA